MTTDPIADFINQLKNAGMVRKNSVSVPYSKIKHEIADKLHKYGYLDSVEKRSKKIKKSLEVTLLYEGKTGNKNPKIRGLERISKPGRRYYKKVNEMHKVKGGRGIMVLSTPKGILTNDEAKKENVGGEALFKIW